MKGNHQQNKRVSTNRHVTHECHIDWTRLDANGSPALCCSQCVSRKGKHKGKPLVINWVSRRAISSLREIGVKEMH